MTGPTGTGDTGPTGLRGTQWYTGATGPSDGTGENGDFYLNTATGDLYMKAGGTWF